MIDKFGTVKFSDLGSMKDGKRRNMKDGEALKLVIIMEVQPTITTIRKGRIELKMRQIE